MLYGTEDTRGVTRGTPPTPDPDDFMGKFYQNITETITSVLQNIFQKIEEEGKPLTSFCKATITWTGGPTRQG